jgi:hypothetical protein
LQCVRRFHELNCRRISLVCQVYYAQNKAPP